VRRAGVLTTCRVARLGRARDEDIQARANGGIEEGSRMRRQRTEGDQIIQVVRPYDVLANVDGPVLAGHIRDHNVQALALALLDHADRLA